MRRESIAEHRSRADRWLAFARRGRSPRTLGSILDRTQGAGPVTLPPEPEPATFAVFPFLKTSAPVRIGSITFRSTADLATLTREQADHVSQIAEMLFLQDDLRIRSACYAVVGQIDFERPTPDLETLVNVQAIVAYYYAAPHDVFGDLFLSSDHASLALFTPRNVSIFLTSPQHHTLSVAPASEPVADSHHMVPGYAGLYNFHENFWVRRGSRLYGPRRHMTLNISQDLSIDFDHRLRGRTDYDLLPRLLTSSATATSERILLAIRWFNAANDGTTDHASAMVKLAIAFETLLSLPDVERKTERLTDAVSLLLGRLPRLDVWARQFYQTRSEIVHEGRSRQWRFVVPGSNRAQPGSSYQPLLSYGRQVFQLCVASLLVGADLARRAGLEEKLVTNQERLEQVCTILSERSVPTADRLRKCVGLVASIERYQFVWESSLKIATMLSASRMAAEALAESDPTLSPALREHLNRFAAVKKTADHYDELDALRELQDQLPDSQRQSDGDDSRDAALRLLHIVWGYTFMYYYGVKERRERDAP